jgi:hypothetical protein
MHDDEKPTAKLILWPDGDVTIEWDYDIRASVPLDRSKAVTVAGEAAMNGWEPQ